MAQNRNTQGWLTLRCSLLGTRPLIWREVRLPAKVTLGKMHKVLQVLFEWKDYHLHEFVHEGVTYQPLHMVEEAEYGDPVDYTKVSLGSLLRRRGHSMLYIYDLAS